MGLDAGTKLGTYEILTPLGAGGMGEVYLAKDSKLDRQVAIKVLPEVMTRDKERVARFEREAKLLASLNHPNIAAIHGFEDHRLEAGATHIIVMEYVDGETLSSHLKNGPVAVEDALDIAKQVAEALEAAHGHGVIHRDLKPANVMIREDGTVKVLDFGLAKAMSDEPSGGAGANSPTITANYTRPGVVLGTAAYMSPEQARGRALDTRTDIWSFGILLFECLTGARLFQGETANDSMGAIMHKEPDWSLLPPSTPPTIQLLLRRCLTKDRKRRLQAIGDARIELEHAIADPSSSSLGFATSALASQGVRNRSSISRGVLGLAIILASVLGGLLGRQLVNDPVSRVRKYEFPLQDHETWNVGQPAISPNGEMVALVDQNRIWIRHLDSWDTRAVDESKRGVMPFWSPDSRWLAFGRGNELVKVPTTGGKPTVVTQAPGTFDLVSGGAWSDDGRIFFSTGDADIFVVSAEGGVPEVYVAADLPDDDDFHELILLPDNKTVVFTVHSRKEAWYLAAFDGSQRKKLFSFDDYFAAAPAYSPTGHILVQRIGGHSSVWAIPFDANRSETTGVPFLVADGDGDPTVSDTGTLVLTRSIVNYFGGELVKVDLLSEEVQPFASPGGVYHDHALSPDETALAVSGFDLNAQDIWILDVKGGSRMRLTYDETKNELLSRWSPDGREIAYAKTTASAFERIAAEDTIHFAAVDGSGETRTPIDGSYPSFDAEWKYVAFVRTNESTGRDIYFMPMDGNVEAQRLLDGPYFEEHPALSPDGHWLAYTSNESGAQRVYLTRFPTGQGKWQLSGQDCALPRWSPDGKRIYFVGPEVGIYEVQLSSEPRVRLTTPRIILDGPKLAIDPYIGMDFTADGKSLIVVKQRGGDRPAAIGVIENWYEEFKGRQ